MYRMREHIDRASGRATVTRVVHQQARVARQSGGVAADVNDAFWWCPATHQRRLWRGLTLFHNRLVTQALLVQVSQRFGQGKRAFARRVYQPFVGCTNLHQHLRSDFKQVACYKVSSCPRSICAG